MLALAVFFILTISGIVDLMAVKNEFAFPFVDSKLSRVIPWIHENTPKNAVFVSYSDIIDPVVLAGRKNYFGFFGNIGLQDRSPIVGAIYKGDISRAVQNNISYILVPKWQKNDFPYTVDLKLLTTKYITAYEDAEFLILRTGVK
jgi:hypothetical protein